MYNDLNRPLVVDAIVSFQNSILIVKRKYEPSKGLWALPGGHVEKDESIYEAVVREVKEETGMLVVPMRIIKIYSDPKRCERQTISICILCFPVHGKKQPQNGSEAEECKWVDATDSSLSLAFDHMEMVKDFLNGEWCI